MASVKYDHQFTEWFWVLLLACLVSVFSSSYSSAVVDSMGSISTSHLEDHPVIKSLAEKIETLELKATHQAEKIGILELKTAQQFEEIQNLKDTIMEQGKELMAQYYEKLNSSEKFVLDSVESKIDALKLLEIGKLEQLFRSAMTNNEKSNIQENQSLNDTIGVHGRNSATETVEDNALVVNLSDYKGGRLTLKTTYGRILAFQPVNNSSLEDALKFIKIISAKDGTYVTLDGNNTLNPDVRHSELAYKTMYAKSNHVVLEFNAQVPDGISIKISKAVECPINLGAVTQCARVFNAESCYCALFTQRTWQEQNAFCQSKEFSLLTLESAEEDKAVTAAWGSLRFWMSLNDRNKEGTWAWGGSANSLSGSDHTNWIKGEPNDNDGSEDCVEWKPVEAGWNDNSCNVQIGAICERQPTSPNKVPSSCADLRNAGQTVSGLYQVQTNDADGKTISTVFCDMDKAIGSTGFETYIGINDVKSSLVHFSVARTSDYEKNGTVIPYDFVGLNLGNAMDIDSGVFAAPKMGIYSFTLYFAELYVGGSSCCIRLDGNCVASGATGGDGADRNTGSVHIVMHLDVGDKVDTFLSSPSDAKLFSNGNKFVRFSGSLLYEWF